MRPELDVSFQFREMAKTSGDKFLGNCAVVLVPASARTLIHKNLEKDHYF